MRVGKRVAPAHQKACRRARAIQRASIEPELNQLQHVFCINYGRQVGEKKLVIDRRKKGFDVGIDCPAAPLSAGDDDALHGHLGGTSRPEGERAIKHLRLKQRFNAVEDGALCDAVGHSRDRQLARLAAQLIAERELMPVGRAIAAILFSVLIPRLTATFAFGGKSRCHVSLLCQAKCDSRSPIH